MQGFELFQCPMVVLLNFCWAVFMFTWWWLPLAKIMTRLKRDLRPRFAKDVWAYEFFRMIEDSVQQAAHDLETHNAELSKENQKFSSLIESLPDPIVAIGKKGEILFYNAEFGRRFCPTSTFHVFNYGRLLSEIYFHPQIQNLVSGLCNNQKVDEITALKIMREEQYLGHFDIRYSPLRIGDHENKGHVLIFHDVRQRKLAEKMREDFVANVSHEVRTPLAALKGFMQVLEEELKVLPQTETAIAALKKIRHNSNRLIALFNDILNLSVIESDTELVLEDVVIEELCEFVVSSLGANYSHTPHKVSIEIAPEARIITAQGRWLEQVLTNLVENAYKYTPAQGHISIKWWLQDGFYWGTVSDNGPGIAAKYLLRIFERFYRVDQGRSQEIQGTGLGLAIAKHVLLRHQGSIEVQSTVGEGTTFIFKIPQNLSSTASP